MNQLFQEDQVTVRFECSKEVYLHKNKVLCHFGKENGFLDKYQGLDYSGYTFRSENELKYFISTQRTKHPKGVYDAVFALENNSSQSVSLEDILNKEKRVKGI